MPTSKTPGGVNIGEAGGYAFPWQNAPGMTLRDFFAAHAIVGVVTAGNALTEVAAANEAYRIADAMLEVRVKSKRE